MRARITAKPKAAPKPRKLNEAQMLLVAQLAGIGERIVPEHAFHPTRKWRIDVALMDQHIAVEIDGGAWIQGRHGRGAGIEKDNEKYAALAIAGWRLIRCTPKQVKNGQALAWIRECL